MIARHGTISALLGLMLTASSLRADIWEAQDSLVDSRTQAVSDALPDAGSDLPAFLTGNKAAAESALEKSLFLTKDLKTKCGS